LAALSSAQNILASAQQLTEREKTGEARARIAQLVEWAELVIQQAGCLDNDPPRFGGSAVDWQLLSN
jgi:hypothetical protein